MRLATQPLILTTLIVGLVILVVGGVVYGRICERVMKPTDAETPATALRDDVDFVPMAKWRNSLIELLNIAGTGPILGPIQGILSGRSPSSPSPSAASSRERSTTTWWA